MKNIIRHKITLLFIVAMGLFMLTACNKKQAEVNNAQEIEESAQDEEASNEDIDETDNTLDIEATPAENLAEEDVIEPTPEPTAEPVEEVKKVDLILFMGQSNMSGCGGDASLAPSVSEDAGMEFRAISDPTKLYPIKEPFGINENNINGLMEKPSGKKGSLVSSFVNEYYAATGNQVIAVSASLGETDMDKWLSENVMLDVMTRYISAREYLTSNGYEIGHKYMIWLQGESDALKKISKDAYKTKMDDFIRPLFMEGLDKVFIITPGRTIDETEIYSTIIKAQKEMCKESGYYALATSVLSGVSTEYMTDIYHYNQHVLNMVGQEAAKSVAYYTNTGHEMVVFDYKEKTMFVPNGSEDYLGQAFGPIELDKINERY